MQIGRNTDQNLLQNGALLREREKKRGARYKRKVVVGEPAGGE